MTGGKIDVITYGSQDLFLTGVPEITFFKFMYKKYTNFSLDLLELKFNGNKNFNEEIICEIQKDGDLLYNTVVKIDLPSVVLKKNTDINLLEKYLNNKNIYEDIYLNYKNYIDYIYKCINICNQGIININYNFQNIIYDVTTFFNNDVNYLFVKNKIEIEILKKFDILSHINNINKIDIDDDNKKYKLKTLLNSYIYLSNNINKILKNNYIKHDKIYNNYLKYNNYNFSWINNLTYNIILKAELEIGGNIIDVQYNFWLYCYYELFETIFNKNKLSKLNSSNSDNFKYNNISKNNFSIYIPLKFFFNRYTNLTLPLISIRYQNILLKLKIEKLDKLIYTNYDDNLDNLIKINNITLLAEYIYIDQDERLKFANNTHEYLIEQVKKEEFIVNKNNEINIDINFSNPIKYLIFVVQNKYLTDELNLHNIYSSEVKYNLIDNIKPEIISSKNNPIKKCNLQLNGIDRFNYLNGFFFNYLIPYELNLSTPSDGINFYNFSIFPKNIQPSGSCNFSKLKKKKFNFFLENDYINNIDNKLIFKFLGINYNILQFKNGLCNTIFNF